MLKGMGFKPPLSDWLQPPAPISIIPCKYDCPVSVRCRVAAFKQQTDGAFYLYEQDVSTRKFDHVFQDRQDQSLLNTGVKNLIAVIGSINRPGRRPILYPYHAIISHEEVRPTPMMHS
jgi:hypothetical protein